MRRLLVLTVAVAAGAFMLAMADARMATAPEEAVLISVPGDAELDKPRVRFPHAPHGTAGVDCTVCHHTWDPATNDPQSCVSQGCHDLGNPADGAEKRLPGYFRNAFHSGEAWSCNGCHKARKDAGETHGPTSCNDCHTVEE